MAETLRFSQAPAVACRAVANYEFSPIPTFSLVLQEAHL